MDSDNPTIDEASSFIGKMHKASFDEPDTVSQYFDPLIQKYCCIYFKNPLSMEKKIKEDESVSWVYAKCNCEESRKEREIISEFCKKRDNLLSSLESYQEGFVRKRLQEIFSFELNALERQCKDQEKVIQKRLLNLKKLKKEYK